MVSESLVICFILFFLVFCNQEICGLHKGDIGTCDGKVRGTGKRPVSYWATGRCRSSPNKVCRIRKWKMAEYSRWMLGTICCKGWQHDAEHDACKPICSTGCINGNCTAPETCTCNPPSYLDPVRKNICLLPPVCKQPCINALCVHNQYNINDLLNNIGVCECLNNTRRYDDYRCHFCKDGFKINPDLTCTPECQTPCVNGECIAPNQCKCFNGYELRDDLTCGPVCKECVNSTCFEPDKCKCLEGFTAVNDTHCFRCDDCENGECVYPGQCVCHEGYMLVDGVCEPVCDPPCVNGVCVAPGVCMCFEEHARSNNPSVCCRPECGTTCDAQGECPSVACVPR